MSFFKGSIIPGFEAPALPNIHHENPCLRIPSSTSCIAIFEENFLENEDLCIECSIVTSSLEGLPTIARLEGVESNIFIYNAPVYTEPVGFSLGRFSSTKNIDLYFESIHLAKDRKNVDIEPFSSIRGKKLFTYTFGYETTDPQVFSSQEFFSAYGGYVDLERDPDTWEQTMYTLETFKFNDKNRAGIVLCLFNQQHSLTIKPEAVPHLKPHSFGDFIRNHGIAIKIGIRSNDFTYVSYDYRYNKHKKIISLMLKKG